MGTAGRIATFLFVWIAIPMVLGVVGYYVVGPRLSQSPAMKAFIPDTAKSKVKTPSVRLDPDPLSDVVVPSDKPSGRFDEPEVEVTVTKIGSRRRKSSSQGSRRQKPTSAPVERIDSQPPNPTEPQDPGSSGGAGTLPGANGLRHRTSDA